MLDSIHFVILNIQAERAYIIEFCNMDGVNLALGVGLRLKYRHKNTDAMSLESRKNV